MHIKPVIIAEIGCNHKGDINLAKELIKSAALCGADYAKFQKRSNKYLLGNKYYHEHPQPHNSYGKTYGEHRDFLEFNISQHFDLYKFCLKNKIKYAVSVWEKISAEEIVNSKIKLDYIKIPSACNLDFELIEYLCLKFKGKIHLSLGMTTRKEIQNIFNFFKKKKRNKDLIFYICTSDYPVKFDDLCLLEIKYLQKLYLKNINSIGFSGHHLGIAADISAYTLGSFIIERHFTLDRTWKGTDHAASLEPSGLSKLIRDLNHVYSALKYKNEQILDSEKTSREKLKIKY